MKVYLLNTSKENCLNEHSHQKLKNYKITFIRALEIKNIYICLYWSERNKESSCNALPCRCILCVLVNYLNVLSILMYAEYCHIQRSIRKMYFNWQYNSQLHYIFSFLFFFLVSQIKCYFNLPLLVKIKWK